MKNRIELLAAAKQGLFRQFKDLPEFTLAAQLGKAIDSYLHDLPLDDASFRAWSDQLVRAAWSVTCNICEGQGRAGIGYVLQYSCEVARGSAAEVLGLLLAAPPRFQVGTDLVRLAKATADAIDRRTEYLLQPLNA